MNRVSKPESPRSPAAYNVPDFCGSTTSERMAPVPGGRGLIALQLPAPSVLLNNAVLVAAYTVSGLWIDHQDLRTAVVAEARPRIDTRQDDAGNKQQRR